MDDFFLSENLETVSYISVNSSVAYDNLTLRVECWFRQVICNSRAGLERFCMSTKSTSARHCVSFRQFLVITSSPTSEGDKP